MSPFSPATLDDLRGVTDVAAREQALAAVALVEADRVEEAAARLDALVASTDDERLLFLAFQFHFRVGNRMSARALAERRLRLAAPGSPAAARAHTNLGLIAVFAPDLDAAEAHFDAAIAIDRALGDDEGLARDLGNASLVPEARGDLEAAELLNREALDLAERGPYPALVASRCNNLGEILRATGRAHEAIPLLEQAAAIFTALGEPAKAAHCRALLDG